MNMTLVEADMYFEFARYNPPVRVLVAAYLGVKPKKRPKPDDMGELLAMFGQGPIR
jgi:hypothetical protein